MDRGKRYNDVIDGFPRQDEAAVQEKSGIPSPSGGAGRRNTSALFLTGKQWPEIGK